MRPTYKDFIEATQLCASHDAKISFAYTKDGSSVCCDERLIEVDLDESVSRAWFWSLVFHELAHLECYDKKIFEIYHHDLLPPKKMYKYVMRHGLRIEHFVDKLGAKNMKKHFPRLKFNYSYDNIRDIKWFYTWVKDTYGN